jgi:hypothetical protein
MWFTGRIAQVDQMVAWVRSGEPGIHLITGSAGTGKTAIAGRVVSLSNPGERERLLSEQTRGQGWPFVHSDPGERSIDAHVHARGLTADQAADLIGDQLVRAGLLTAQERRRNAAELAGQVQRAAEDTDACPVVVVDGLDEARSQALLIAQDLLIRIASYATVIVATRELAGVGAAPSLLEVLTAECADLALDLEDAAIREQGRSDVRAYVTPAATLPGGTGAATTTSSPTRRWTCQPRRRPPRSRCMSGSAWSTARST